MEQIQTSKHVYAPICTTNFDHKIICHVSQNGYTALILASREGHHEIVKILLDPTNPIKTDVHIKNKTVSA